MELHNLTPAKGSIKKKKIIARGQGSGRGGTSTRGHKGQKSRSGYSRKRHFEGGQTPLQMRLPKRGFKNINRVEYVVFNVGRLQEIANKFEITTIDFDTLVSLGIIRKNDLVKVLGTGEATSALNIKVHKFSESAKNLIESKGGSIEALS